ncbi:hypothetical protein ABZ726_12160 [Streptomyces hundungensis]|uniref:hypothetical protein n=1 Tax=Streptomyces hundungensis TaxID=1077946 RepID=UPI0034097CBE
MSTARTPGPHESESAPNTQAEEPADGQAQERAEGQAQERAEGQAQERAEGQVKPAAKAKPRLDFDDPLDQQSADDTDRGWGERPASAGSAADLARFLDEKPPHHI